MLQRSARLVVSSLHLAGRTAVDENMVRFLAGIPYERDFAQLLLHHPLESTAQVAEYQENVERSLMVAYEYV